MAMTYDEILRRLGRRMVVQVDKRRGTEIRRAPGEAGDHGDIQIRYRGTPVVTLHPDGTYTLRTGGLATRTVRNRIAEYSPVSLVQRGGGYFFEDVATGALQPFLEGARVDAHGHLTTAGVSVGSARGAAPAPSLPSTTSPATTATAIDEARLRGYVRQIVMDALQEFSTTGHLQLPPVATGTPVRAARMRATARELPPPPRLRSSRSMSWNGSCSTQASLLTRCGS